MLCGNSGFAHPPAEIHGPPAYCPPSTRTVANERCPAWPLVGPCYFWTVPVPGGSCGPTNPLARLATLGVRISSNQGCTRIQTSHVATDLDGRTRRRGRHIENLRGIRIVRP